MISIIVPVYRAEKSLQVCVESLINQTYRDIEIILVNDGSPDKSGEICDMLALSDSRITVIHKENGGVSSARNAGIKCAKGDYIAFVDSDDYTEPDYIEKMQSVLFREGEEHQAWCCLQTVAGYKKENQRPNFVSEEEHLIFDRTDIMTLHKMWVDAGPCNKLFCAEVIRREGISFDTAMSLGEDLLFNWQYLDAMGDMKICVITKPLYNYVHIGNESLDGKYRPDMLDIYRRINSECLKYLNKWNVSGEQMKLYYDSCFYTYEKVMRNDMCAPDKSFFRRVRGNSRLIKSREFKEIYSKRTCFIHPLYKIAYSLNSYLLVHIINKISAKR